jgi:hypothetical protein
MTRWTRQGNLLVKRFLYVCYDRHFIDLLHYGLGLSYRVYFLRCWHATRTQSSWLVLGLTWYAASRQKQSFEQTSGSLWHIAGVVWTGIDSSRVESCHAESSWVVSRFVKLSRVESCRVKLCRVEPCRVEPFRVVSSRVELCHVEPCRVDLTEVRGLR